MAQFLRLMRLSKRVARTHSQMPIQWAAELIDLKSLTFTKLKKVQRRLRLAFAIGFALIRHLLRTIQF